MAFDAVEEANIVVVALVAEIVDFLKCIGTFKINKKNFFTGGIGKKSF